MKLEYFLYLSLLLGWALNIYSFCRFAIDWQEREPAPLKAWCALAAVCLPALAVTFFLAARGGLDNGRDFIYLGSSFLPADLDDIFKFKEISPLFIKQAADELSGNSLCAVLWANRLLVSASAFLFFAVLRRLGAGLAACFSASALLFWSFPALLNADTFSANAPDLFIWMLALAAIADAHMSAEIGGRRLAWILGSSLLLAGAHYELLPANLALLAASAAIRPGAWKKSLGAAPARWLLPAAACFAGAWLVHFHGLRVGQAGPASWLLRLKILAARSCARNFLTIAGASGELAPEDYTMGSMSRQLDLFLIFACLFAFAAAKPFAWIGQKRKLWRNIAVSAGLMLLSGYALLNVSAALRLNGERSQDDLELEFLSEAQRADTAGCMIYYSGEYQYRAAVLKKYFHFTGLCENRGTARGPSKENCVLEYLPPSAASIRPKLARMDPEAILRVKAACPAGPPVPGPGPARSSYAAFSKPGAIREDAYYRWRNISEDIRSALPRARTSNRRVMLIVGGDWCDWCGTMEKFINGNTDIKIFLKNNFVEVKVFFDPHYMRPPEALAGYPQMPAYPHIFVLNSDGTLFESRGTAALENGAGGYDRKKFRAFLKEAAPPSK